MTHIFISQGWPSIQKVTEKKYILEKNKKIIDSIEDLKYAKIEAMCQTDFMSKGDSAFFQREIPMPKYLIGKVFFFFSKTIGNKCLEILITWLYITFVFSIIKYLDLLLNILIAWFCREN